MTRKRRVPRNATNRQQREILSRPRYLVPPIRITSPAKAERLTAEKRRYWDSLRPHLP